MLLCICKGPRKGANYCTEETMCSLQLRLQPEKQTKIPTTCTLCWYTLVHFPGCTLCWYLGMFSWLYTLCWYSGILVSFFLVIHFVGILVHYSGCELGCKSTHCLFSTVISSFLGSLEATSVIMTHLK